MDTILDGLKTVWPYLLSVLHLVGAAGVTVHAILRKHDVGSAIAWIGLAWLSPLIGTGAYLVLGINRIKRKGVSLGLSEVWNHDYEQRMTEEDDSRIHLLKQFHPTFESLAKLGGKVTGGPPLMGNAVTPLINGDAAYPEMLTAINNATVSIAFNSYIFDYDEVGKAFLQALKKAQARGVLVRVLIDGVGAKYSEPSMVDEMKKAGITVAAFLPSKMPLALPYANLRNHRKILVVDGRIGFTGGTNIRIDHCLDRQPAFPVACLHFKIEGPVVSQLQEMFAIDWSFTTQENLMGPDWFPKCERSGNVGARGIPDGPDEDLDKISEIIMGALAVAQKRVRIVTPYFLPDPPILKALAVAALRGVKVEILLPSKNNIVIMNWAIVPQLPHLIEKGCRIFTSPAPFDHTKLFVVDGLWSLIGSTNWDPRSLRLNFEYNIECYDAGLARSLDAIMDEKFARAKEVTIEELAARPRWVKLRDGAARLLSPYL